MKSSGLVPLLIEDSFLIGIFDLSRFFPMHRFSNPRKRQKTLRFQLVAVDL